MILLLAVTFFEPWARRKGYQVVVSEWLRVEEGA